MVKCLVQTVSPVSDSQRTDTIDSRDVPRDRPHGEDFGEGGPKSTNTGVDARNTNTDRSKAWILGETIAEMISLSEVLS